MAKYKVGDKVKVKSWEEMEKEYGKTDIGEIDTRYVFTRAMKCFCNKTVEIAEVYSDDTYKIKEDNGVFSWVDEMFEPIEKLFTKDDLKTGMLVQVKNGEYYRVLLKKCIKKEEIDVLEKLLSNTYLLLDNYSNDLRNKINDFHDICKVLMPEYPHSNAHIDEYEVIWERQVPKKMTLKEIEKVLGYDIEIVGDE